MNRKMSTSSIKSQEMKTGKTASWGTFKWSSKIQAISKQKAMNGYLHNIYSNQISTLNRIFMIVMLIELFLLYLYVQFDLSNKPNSLWFLLCSNICGALAACILSLRFKCRDQQIGLTDEVQESIFELVVKILIIIITPYGFLEDVSFQSESVSEIYYTKVNHLLTIITFYKNVMFVGMIFTESQYMKPRANRISKLYGSASGNIFALRAIFKDSPFSFVFAVFTASIFIFTFAFRVAQSAVYSSSDPGTVYLNMGWMTMITMTTVGYGDYSPRTPVGRIIGGLCVIWGGLFLSVTVVVVTKAFSMNKNQSQALRIIKKLQHRVLLRQVAALYLRQKLWRVWTNYKYRLSKSPKLVERKLLIKFKLLSKQQKTSFQCSNHIQLYNNLQKKFQGAFVNIEIVSENSLNLINYLNEKYFFNQWQWKKKKQPKVKIMVKTRAR